MQGKGKWWHTLKGAQKGCSSLLLKPLITQADIPQSVMHGQRDAGPTVTFPAAEHCHCPLTDTHFLPHRWWRLSWPEWLATYQYSIPANGHPSQY